MVWGWDMECGETHIGGNLVPIAGLATDAPSLTLQTQKVSPTRLKWRRYGRRCTHRWRRTASTNTPTSLGGESLLHCPTTLPPEKWRKVLVPPARHRPTAQQERS